MTATDSRFHTLYPDVDPETPVPLSTPERIGIVVATAVIAFGGAYGDLLITGAGLALVLIAVIGATRKTKRRIRNEARDRFPGMGWAEDQVEDSLGRSVTLPLIWLGILAICLLTLRFVPAEYALSGATAAALTAAALVWFAPGLSPRRRAGAKKLRSEED